MKGGEGGGCVHILIPPSFIMDQSLILNKSLSNIKHESETLMNLIKDSVFHDHEVDRRTSHTFIRYLKEVWQGETSPVFDAPLWVGWKITPRCDMECEHCWANLSGVDQPLELMLETAKKIADAGVMHVTITGGEPFLRKDIFEILEYLKSRRVFIEIFSNGSFINEERARKLASILDRASDSVQISLDGATDSVHDKQRRKGSFTAAVRAIKLLKAEGIKVRVNFVSTPINVHELADAYLLADQLGVDIFSASAVYPTGRGMQLVPEMDYSNHLDQLLRCSELRKQCATHFRPFLPIELFAYTDPVLPVQECKPFRLEEGHLYWSIDSEGDVYPSIDLYHPDLNGGNIYTTSVEEIQKNLVSKMGIRDLRNTKCEVCPHYSLCQGGDLGRVYRKYGHFNGPDPQCMRGEI